MTTKSCPLPHRSSHCAGKVGKSMEFGAKLDISAVDGEDMVGMLLR